MLMNIHKEKKGIRQNLDSRVICDYLNFNARNGCPRGRKLYFMLKNTFQACKTCPNHPINVQKRPPFVFPYYVKTFQNQPLNVQNSLFLVFPTIKGKPKGDISVIYRLILTCFTCLNRVFRQKTQLRGPGGPIY